jgi:hypothetical protein
MAKDPLFQPQQLGSLTLPNRVVMTTVKLGYGTQSGEMNDHHIAFNTRRAQGEAALLTTEPLFIQENGRELPTQLRINDDAVHTDRKVTQLTANTTFAQRNDYSVPFPIKTAVIAVGVIPDRQLVDPLEQNGIETYVVGDAVQPREA